MLYEYRPWALSEYCPRSPDCMDNNTASKIILENIRLLKTESLHNKYSIYVTFNPLSNLRKKTDCIFNTYPNYNAF